MIRSKNQLEIPDSVKLAALSVVPRSLRPEQEAYSQTLLREMQSLLEKDIKEDVADNRGKPVDESGAGVTNIIKYAYKGGKYEDSNRSPAKAWCQATVAYADRQNAEKGAGVILRTAWVAESMKDFADHGALLFKDSSSQADIYPGMTVYLKRGSGGGIWKSNIRDMDGEKGTLYNYNHVGVIESVDANEKGENGVYVIFGNEDLPDTRRDGIAKKFIPFDDTKLVAFGDTNMLAHNKHPDRYPSGQDVHSAREKRENEPRISPHVIATSSPENNSNATLPRNNHTAGKTTPQL